MGPFIAGDSHESEFFRDFGDVAIELQSPEELCLVFSGVGAALRSWCRHTCLSTPPVTGIDAHAELGSYSTDGASTIEAAEELFSFLRFVLDVVFTSGPGHHTLPLIRGVATMARIQASQGKLYLCAIEDVFSSRIVGYSISSRMKARLAVDALQMAVARRGDVAGCTVHSDRGSQFLSRKFVRALAGQGLVGSMGRVGAAGDNAAMESFLALLWKNVLDRGRWATRDQLRIAIVTWIERTYHRRRRQVRLGRLIPVEYEAIIETAVLAA
ncbi:DDE-type integrase/transposase/recombinase [Glutamicibacter sp. BW78]|uniref:DDE-type integrase/transposase/recombinase n=1 Tax=Glutamicibacter sp. BW78 TaxID=2024403 RepID=UPI00210F798E|nr:DDE-type integrase/transposase/recombinase [Glutamicibacter sp. BW78]